MSSTFPSVSNLNSYETSSISGPNPFLTTSTSSSNAGSYQSSSPVIGDVNLLTTINSGSTFNKVNPIPTFETAYPPTNSGSSFSKTFQNPGPSLGSPPSGFPSSNNYQSDSYGSPSGPILGSSNQQFSTSAGFSQSSTPVLSGQIVATSNSGFQAVDSYGLPIAPAITPIPNVGISATSGYGGPSTHFSQQSSSAAVAPSSSYGVPLAPVINSWPLAPPVIQQPLSIYGTSPGPIVSSVQAPQSGYVAPIGPIIGESTSPGFSSPAGSSYESPALFNSEPSLARVEIQPTLGAFIGSLDQSSQSYESPPDTSSISSPSSASTFLHVQDGSSGECHFQ